MPPEPDLKERSRGVCREQQGRDYMKKETAKTNAMRELERAKIPYTVHAYEVAHDEFSSGVESAGRLGVDVNQVYKTLVTKGHSGALHVFVIPAAAELDLKKAARSVGEKNAEMIPVKDLLKYTGYVRGGCSPLGMKKKYGTVIDASAGKLSTFLVSAGKIGVSVEVDPEQLSTYLQAPLADVIKTEP